MACAWLAADPVKGIGSLLPALQILIAAALVTLVAILFAARQSSSRLPSSRPGVPGPLRRDLDDCWRFRVFYYNPDDPAILVEKRYGIGYTLNFAQPAAWVMLIVILVCILVPVLWIRHLFSRVGLH
ncbi:MAG TPA: DUF5808 domain-containing protein [Terriglobales bacterium]|nr:DUF5808 domain-containing protein [Terriglobales bacterium]